MTETLFDGFASPSVGYSPLARPDITAGCSIIVVMRTVISYSPAMTDNTRVAIGAIMMLLPLLVATYYRGLASAAFEQARAFAPANGQAVPSLAATVVAVIFSIRRGGGPEFFWSPEWMAAVTHPQGRQHIAAFKRYRLTFWLFMASLPAWFMLVSRLFWK